LCNINVQQACPWRRRACPYPEAKGESKRGEFSIRQAGVFLQGEIASARGLSLRSRSPREPFIYGLGLHCCRHLKLYQRTSPLVDERRCREASRDAHVYLRWHLTETRERSQYRRCSTTTTTTTMIFACPEVSSARARERDQSLLPAEMQF
jgi:hypothetical protein